jgi:hypothetical protein
MTRLREAVDWLVDAFRGLYPFVICWIGALAFAVGWHDQTEGAALVVTAIAGLSFTWAIDLAYARGKAKGESETAAKMVALITSGADTTISIEINEGRAE